MNSGRFVDRRDAGRQLALRVAALKLDRPIVYALPRGGVPVAAEIAAAIDAPLDLVLVRKIGAPRQPELALGASTCLTRELRILNAEFEDRVGTGAR